VGRLRASNPPSADAGSRRFRGILRHQPNGLRWAGERPFGPYCRGPWCVLSFEAVALLRNRGYQAGSVQSNGMCLAEFDVYSNLKLYASTERIVDLSQVTS
jgi:hypothetical protein